MTMNRPIEATVAGRPGRGPGLAVALAATTMLSPPALAQNVLPTGGQVVSGAASITSSGQAMTINQSTDRLIANWQSFSIGAGNSVTFNQPGASAVALNRVVGQDPSQILGSLSANSQVFLVNPNGIAIGRSGQVQTGAFVGSTLGIADADFRAGRYSFTGTTGTIVNEGRIAGRAVALIAPTVVNAGTIRGNTALAAGTDVLLDVTGDGLVSVEVKASTVATLVENRGLIRAGRQAILTARGASQALRGVVNNTGTIEAGRIGRRNGRILLLGDMQNGEVNAGGRLRARSVETSARKVTLDRNLKVDTQGGHWLIDPTDITIDASYAAALQSGLATGDVTVTTASAGAQTGNIFVNAPVSWGAHVLTLRADNSIVVNAPLTSTGTTASDGLVLQYAQTTASGTYAINAPVNLVAGSLFRTQRGADAAITYTVITSLGAEGSASGTDLQGMTSNLAGNYVLGADIDASATSGWNSGAGFAPIALGINPFTGIFDGLGHTISGLTINRPNQYYVGLFGNPSGATIRNIGLIRAAVTGLANVGGLAGAASNSTITNAYATGSIIGVQNVGGLIGNSSRNTISFSSATATVSGNNGIGGLVGYDFMSTISNSHASGWTLGTGSAAGGLVGVSAGSAITNSYASGAVSGNINVGGLVGSIDTTSVSNSYATGAVTGTDFVGGLIGYVLSGTVDKTYANGRVTGTSYAGGLIGWNGGTITASFYDSEATRQGAGCSNTCSVAGLTTAQMNNPFTFIDAGWDFAGVWGTPKAGGAPLLRATTSTPLYDYYVRLSGSLTRSYGDGNPSLAGITRDGLGAGNVALNWGSAITASTNAGTYAWSTANVLSLSFSAGAAGDYYVDYGSGGLSIARRVVNLSGSRTYDGTTGLAAAIFTLGNLANGEMLTLSGTGSMADKKVGTGKDVILDTLMLGNGSGLASNYTLVGGTDRVDIGKAVISAITGITADKTYDRTTAAPLNISGAAFTGMVSGDRLTVASGTGIFADRNAGTGKTVTITGLTLGGADAGNYTLTGTTATISATIAKAAITAIGGITAANKTYDGSTTAVIDTSAAVFSGLITGDALTVTGTGAFANKNAGTAKTVIVTGLALGGADASNYTLGIASAAASADIAKAVITSITGITAASRVYDGTATAVITTSGAVFSGLIPGDALTVAGMGTFADKNVGTNKAVTITGLTLGGADASNYTLAGTTAMATADITRAVITSIAGITAASRIYDGSTSAVLDTTGAVFNGMVSGDSLTVASGVGAFADKNAATGKTVTISGLTLGGTDAGNYTLAGSTATTTADIAKAVITSIAGITAANKTYDSSTTAVIDLSGAVLTGMVSGDRLTLQSGTGAFADRNAGAGKTVTVTGLTLGGADAGNYTLAGSTATATADIAQAVITSVAGITAASKTYDGSAAAVVDLSGAVFSGLFAGDTLTVSGTASFADKNAGTGKTVTVAGLTLGGADARNYRLASTTVTASADIAQAVISSISGIAARNKIFDGTATAPLDLSGANFNGMIAGDQLGVGSALGRFDSAAPGHAKPVRITGLVLGGADAGNYRLADTTASTVADIVITNSAPLLPDQIDSAATPGFAAPTSVLLDPGLPLIVDLRFRH